MSDPKKELPAEYDSHDDFDLPDVDEDGMAADEDWPGGVCGRWNNGRLGAACRLAGTEDCDWECPHRDRSFLKAIKR